MQQNKQESHHKKKNILIIDDENDIRQLLRYHLEKYEYRTFLAENGKDGITLFESHNIDLVLVDLLMPQVNGFDVIGYISDLSPITPLIVYSASQEPTDIIRSFKRGAWDYLMKPLESLNSIIESVEKGLLKAQSINEEIINNQQFKGLIGDKKESIITLCCHCKKVKNKDDSWGAIEKLIGRSLRVAISHGICTNCIKEHYSDINIAGE